MHIEIHASGLTLTDLLRERLRSRLASVLRPFLASVSRVSARISDVNAQRGGLDKRCRLVATIPGRNPVVVNALHQDTLASINTAASRFRQALSRSLSRATSRKRRVAHEPPRAPETATDPRLLLSDTDVPRLRELLDTLPRAPDALPAMEQLKRDLDRASVLPPPEMPPAIVTMRSSVRIEDLHTGDKDAFTLVYPGEADLFEGKLSVLAPLGAALLGAKTGDILNVPVKNGVRRIRVDRLLYQPEAAGDFDL
jgi:regulator of nucleoside diphosphate kinase